MSRTGLPFISMNSRVNSTRTGRGAAKTRHIYGSLSKVNPRLTVARLALVQGVATVLASGLTLLGVGAPEEMR